MSCFFIKERVWIVLVKGQIVMKRGEEIKSEKERKWDLYALYDFLFLVMLPNLCFKLR